MKEEKEAEEEVKTQTSKIVEPEAEDMEPEDKAGKFMLLERLMKFIR